MLSRLLVVMVVSVVALAVGAGSAAAQCVDGRVKSAPEGAKHLVEFDSPSTPLTLALDADHAGDDDTTLVTKDGRSVGTAQSAAGAVITAFPRKGTHRLKATMTASATPVLGGRRVSVEACVADKDRAAGVYQGAVTITGPRIADTTLPVTITTKWPPTIPVLALILVILAIGGYAIYKGVTNEKVKTLGTIGGVVISVLVGGGAAALTYWGTYASNDTWGSDPPAQIIALVTGAATAAVAGIAAARGFLTKMENGS